jgi:ribonuclease HI
MRAVVYFDGGCQPQNPGGIATYGYWLYDPDNKKKLYEHYGVCEESNTEHATNNIAEYAACMGAIACAHRSGKVKRILVRGDSQLIIKQLLGEWRCKNEKLKKYYNTITVKLLPTFDNVVFQWIPREKNTYADLLSNRAYEKYCKDKGIPATPFKTWRPAK